jgi:hypothetical protein
MVAAQVAVSLTVLLGVAAIAVDGGLLLAERRHAQAVADAAALAGAVDLFKNYPTNQGVDKNSTASKSALAAAADNGYANDGTNSVVTVNIPPTGAKTAYFNGKAGYVEVNVTYKMVRGLSGIWGSSRVNVSAHAIARGQWVPPSQGILTLDPTASASMKVSGGGSATVNGGGTVVVDSNSGSALTNTGGGSVTASAINVVGGTSGGGTYSPTPNTNNTSYAVQDPLSPLPAPSPPAPGSIAKTSLGSGNFRYVLTPGSYDGNGGPSMPNFSSGDQVVFTQASKNSAGGIYYLYKGLSDNGASLLMDSALAASTFTTPTYTNQGTTGGIMFYNAGSGPSQSFSITGNASGTVNLSAMDGSVSSTDIYKGILYFQARTSSQDVTISGNGSFDMEGTFYAPDAGLKITGNTSSPPSIIGSQYIADSLTLGGSGSFIVNFAGGTIAPVRYIALVE